MEYIEKFSLKHSGVVIFDRITGNAAALLSVIARAQEIHSLIGSQQAIATLENYQIKYHFRETVPFIQKEQGAGMCPMEKMSLGKSPEEFYTTLKAGNGK